PERDQQHGSSGERGAPPERARVEALHEGPAARVLRARGGPRARAVRPGARCADARAAPADPRMDPGQEVRLRGDRPGQRGQAGGEGLERLELGATRLARAHVSFDRAPVGLAEQAVQVVVELHLRRVRVHRSISLSSERARWSCAFTVPMATPSMRATSSCGYPSTSYRTSTARARGGSAAI